MGLSLFCRTVFLQKNESDLKGGLETWSAGFAAPGLLTGMKNRIVIAPVSVERVLVPRLPFLSEIADSCLTITMAGHTLSTLLRLALNNEAA